MHQDEPVAPFICRRACTSSLPRATPRAGRYHSYPPPPNWQLVLAKKGPLGKIWLAAHMEKKVPKVQIMSTNIPESVDNIENPDCPMALRVSGHLLLGVVRIFSRKVSYLMSDCSEAIVKIKDAFSGPGVVHLAPGASTRRYDEITNPEGFDEMDLDTALPSQAFARNDDDDLLAGMSLPEGAFGDVTLGEPQLEMEGDIVLDGGFGGRPAFGDDGYGAEETEAVSGFGVNDNIEVFQAPLEPPSAKRARRSPAPEARDEEEEEEEMEVERMRSALDGASPVGAGIGGLVPSDMPELPLGPEPELDFEPPRFDEGDLQLDQGLGAAVVDEFDVVRRTSRHVAHEPPPPPKADEGQAARRPKRKMMMDAELQISTAQVRSSCARSPARCLTRVYPASLSGVPCLCQHAHLCSSPPLTPRPPYPTPPTDEGTAERYLRHHPRPRRPTRCIPTRLRARLSPGHRPVPCAHRSRVCAGVAPGPAVLPPTKGRRLAQAPPLERGHARRRGGGCRSWHCACGRR